MAVNIPFGLIGGGSLDLLGSPGSFDLLEELPFVLTTRGREGIGVDQPQSSTDYPFVQPSEDIRYLLADAYLAYESPDDYNAAVSAYAVPFYIAWLYGLGEDASSPPGWAPTPVHDVDLVVKDADGVTVFDSTLAESFTTTVWTERLTIYEWITSNAVCRIVVHTAWPTYGAPEPRSYAEHIVPDNAVLDPRVLYRMPKRVRSLAAVLDSMAGDIELIADYNMRFQVEPITGNRIGSRVRVSAPAGAGTGIFPGCTEPDPLLRTINNVQPSSAGDFLIKATDCYYLRQPVTVTSTDPREVRPTVDLDPTAAHLELGIACKACCDCSDYVDVAKYMNRWRDRYVDLGAVLSGVRDLHHLNIERWDDYRTCRLNQPLQLVMRAQACPFVDVAVQFVNQTATCLKNITLIIRFRTDPEIAPSSECTETSCTGTIPALPAGNDSVEVVPAYTTISDTINPYKMERYTLAGGWSEYRAYWDAINPYQRALLRFRLKLPDGGIGMAGDGATAVPYAITGCAEVASEGQYICGPNGLRVTANANVSLLCE